MSQSRSCSHERRRFSQEAGTSWHSRTEANKTEVVSNETELSNLEDGSVENARDICAHIEQDWIMSLMRLSCLIFKPAQDGGHTIIARVIRLYALTHARASYAHYLNGYFAGNSGHLARKTRCEWHQRQDQVISWPTKKEYPSDLIIIILDDKSREFEFSFPDVNDNV